MDRRPEKSKDMKHLTCTALALLIGCTSMPQETATRRVPQFDNEHVEVWKSIILPDQPLSMHRHDHPRAIIALQGGTLRVVSESGETRDMTWETGSAYWLEADPPGELHGDLNQGGEPVEVIVVQLKDVTGPGG